MLHRRIPILLYHGISTTSTRTFNEWVVHPARFAEQMDYLVAQRYTAITVEELTRALAHGGAPLPRQPVVITFDDGFADFYEQALPVLEPRGLRATLYVITGYVGSTARWLIPQGEGGRTMLNWRQITEAVSRGVECGAHSHSHPRLDELRLTVAREEIRRSKELLEDRLGVAVNSFAYPHGYWSPRVRSLVEEAGFSSSVAVRKAMSSPRDDPFSMARIVVPGRADAALFASLVQGRGLPTAPLPERQRTKVWRGARRSVRCVRRRPLAALPGWVRRGVLRGLLAGIALAALVLVMRGHASAHQAGPPGEGWRLAFEDDFKGIVLDRSKWTTCYWWDDGGCTNEGTGELQWYRPEGVRVDDGRLRLTAERRTVRGPDGRRYPFRSGMVTTGRSTADESQPPRFAFRYGYVEMRARVPAGQGLWSAFWLLPTTHESRPEIDVMEVLGHEPDVFRARLHVEEPDGEKRDPGQDTVLSDLSAGWHTFGLRWQPDALIWFVDGVEQWRVTDPELIPSQDLYLLANLAVGGDWPGPPDGTTPFPSTFEIDWIRVWRQGGQ